MKPKTAIGCLLLCMGLSVMLYPWARAWYFERQKQLVTQQWLETRTAEESVISAAPFASDTTGSQDQDTSVNPHSITFAIENMEGILSIPSIDLQTPILSENTEYNLNLAICRLSGSEAGEYGNYCLAGHKSRMYGRHFNRLHEVGTGDLIMVETAQEEYVYQVTDFFTVTAEDDWVLEDDFDKKQITLITCDYSTRPIGRLIVRGVLAEEVS